MRQDIKNIEALKGESAVKDAIVKSIRDFKQLRYTKGEIMETMETIFGEKYKQFCINQFNSL